MKCREANVFVCLSLFCTGRIMFRRSSVREHDSMSLESSGILSLLNPLLDFLLPSLNGNRRNSVTRHVPIPMPHKISGMCSIFNPPSVLLTSLFSFLNGTKSERRQTKDRARFLGFILSMIFAHCQSRAPYPTHLFYTEDCISSVQKCHHKQLYSFP